MQCYKVCIYTVLPRAGYDTRSIFKRTASLNLESSSQTGCLTKAKEWRFPCSTTKLWALVPKFGAFVPRVYCTYGTTKRVKAKSNKISRVNWQHLV